MNLLKEKFFQNPQDFIFLKKRKLSSFMSGLIAIGIIWGFGLACANPTSKNVENAQSESSSPTNSDIIKSTPVVDIPSLIRKSPEVFEKTFGKATEISKTNDPGTVPGEIRDYKVSESNPRSTTDGMMVRFYKGKAVMIMVDLPLSFENAEEALSRVGLDAKGIPPTVEAPLAHRWRDQSFNGIKFKDVGVHKLDKDGTNFTTVQAQVDND